MNIIYEKDVPEVFGNPGESLAVMTLPFPMRRAYNLVGPPVEKIILHKDVHSSLYNALTEIVRHYSFDRLKAFGLDILGETFCYRRINSEVWGQDILSLHAYGIAIDINPHKNQETWERQQAAMPEIVIDIFEKHGWWNLGRYLGKNFMHFQAANPG